MTVAFGTATATVNVINGNVATTIAPKGAGTVDISITNPDMRTAKLGSYTYADPKSSGCSASGGAHSDGAVPLPLLLAALLLLRRRRV